MNSDFLVTRILNENSSVSINTEVFGDIEVRSYKYDLESEIVGFLQSASSQWNKGEDYEKIKIYDRISTIVTACSHDEAVLLADNKFTVFLDLRSGEFSGAYVDYSKIGITRNLTDGIITPIEVVDFVPSSIFIVNHNNIQKYNDINFMMDNESELVIRYQKALHWNRHANIERNKQLKILFSYFCLEALFKIDDKDNISGLVRCFLGYPNGDYYKLADKNKINLLSKDKNYVNFNKTIPIILDEIRELRNKSVHAGYRISDINYRQLVIYNETLTYAKSRSLRAVRHAILGGIESVSEFKEYAGIIYNDTVDVNDILNNVLFGLKRAYEGNEY